MALIKARYSMTHSPLQFSSVHFSSVAQLSPTCCDPMDCSTPGFQSIANSQSLLKLMSIELGIHLTIYPVIPFSSCLQSFLASGSFPMSQFFISGGQIINNIPSNKYSGLVSFRMDWLDLLAVQGTLKSLLQHHSSKTSILWCSAFFMVQLSHPYMTTGKTIA